MDEEIDDTSDSFSLGFQNKWQPVMAIIGFLLFGWGLVGWFSNQNQDHEVEIIRSETKDSRDEVAQEIVVDVSGAIVNPGVYRVESDCRVGEVIQKAGGLLDQADRGYVEQKINLAQVLVDGVKIYVPFLGEKTVIGENQTVQGGAMDEKSTIININIASSQELESLWGIGQARAMSIINNRPYQSIEEIKAKANIPDNVFEEIKEQISTF